MDFNDIVDRNEDTSWIEEDIRKCSGRSNRVLVLYAKSGIGKSAVVRKVASMIAGGNFVIAETPPINANETPYRGQYLARIAAALDEYGEPRKYDLKSFLFGGSSSIQLYQETKALADAGHSATSALAALLAAPALRGEARAKIIMGAAGINDLLILEEYVEHALKRFKPVLSIPNAQNLDSHTQEFLRRLLRSVDGLYLILEYTTKGDREIGPAQLASFFRDASPKVRKLEALETKHIPDLLGFDESTSIADMGAAFRIYENDAAGNLFQLILACEEKVDAHEEGADPTVEAAHRLSMSNQIILAMLCLLDGEARQSDIETVIDAAPASLFYDDNRSALAPLVDASSDTLRLRHASIIDSLLDENDYPVKIAYKLLRDYYIGVAGESGYTDDALVALMKLYSRFEPIEAVALLQVRRNMIVRRIPVPTFAPLLDRAFDSMSNWEARLRIVNLCYEIGLHDQAFSQLNRLEEREDLRFWALRCLLLNRADRNEEALELCKSLLLRHKGSGARFRLILSLTKMICERTLNMVGAYQSTYQSIVAANEFHEFPEYGIALRNSIIALPFMESIEPIERSVAFFYARGDVKNACQAQVALAVQKARVGDTEQAMSIIDTIREDFLETTFEHHVIYLNEATIRLLDGHPDDVTEALIRKASMTALSTFEKLACLNCEMCIAIVNEWSIERFEELRDRMLSTLQDEPDPKVAKRCYANLYLYYRDVAMDEPRANLWRGRAREIVTQSNSYDELDCLISDHAVTRDNEFLAARNYAAPFLSYWHFDLPFNDL